MKHELVENLKVLYEKIKNRKNQNLLIFKIVSLLKDLKKICMTKSHLYRTLIWFIVLFVSYIKKRIYHFDKLKVFRSVQLINWPSWDDVQQSTHFLMKKNKSNIGWKLDEDDLFDDMIIII